MKNSLLIERNNSWSVKLSACILLGALLVSLFTVAADATGRKTRQRDTKQPVKKSTHTKTKKTKKTKKAPIDITCAFSPVGSVTDVNHSLQVGCVVIFM